MVSVRWPSAPRYILYLLAICALISTCAGLAIAERVERRNTTIAPWSITPSQDWDGNDGSWSSFTLQIGSPPQSVKVLISTASTQSWAIAEEGCQSGDPSDCASLRGNLYNHSLSNTWVSNTQNSTSNIYALGLESSLGYNDSSYRGRYGFDSITLGFAGSNGPTLENQTIAEVAVDGFFMGYFGLNPAPSNFNDDTNPVPSYLWNLQNQSLIPSLSWGYTAGNQYRLSSPVLGSLTLGGYDSSRFVANDLSFNFSQADNGYLGVTLQALTSGITDLLPEGSITTFLDSTLPYIYLPLSACLVFESVFGLEWNETSQLYLVNSTQYLLLQSSNPSITFTLSVPNSTTTNSGTVNVTLPYAAFDLTASWPLAASATKFFPLRRANDSSQYILGRTFFQEAYITADFERGNFSVSACNWDGKPENLITILPLNSTSTPQREKSVLGVGAIAGIAVGGAAILLFLGLLIYFCWYRPRKQKSKDLDPLSAGNSHSAPTGEAESYNKPELDNTSIMPHELQAKPRNPDGTPIAEADSTKIDRYEMDATRMGKGRDLEPIFELPVNEEVAVELGSSEGVNTNENGSDEREDRARKRRSGGGGIGTWSWFSNKSSGKNRLKRNDSGSTSTTAAGSGNESTSSGWRSTETRYASLAQEQPDEIEGGASRHPSFRARSPHDHDPGTDTLSSLSSGWGAGSGTERSGRSLGDIVSPETPGPAFGFGVSPFPELGRDGVGRGRNEGLG